jgi:hypothetical protein
MNHGQVSEQVQNAYGPSPAYTCSLHSMSVNKAFSIWGLTREGRSLNSPPGTVHDFIPTYC